MWGGASTPAMSRKVGAKSMLRTISSTLRRRQKNNSQTTCEARHLALQSPVRIFFPSMLNGPKFQAPGVFDSNFGGRIDVDGNISHWVGHEDSHSAGLHPGAAHQEGHPHVELEREGLSLDQAELAEVVAVVRRVQDVGVVHLPQRLELLVHLRTKSLVNIPLYCTALHWST